MTAMSDAGPVALDFDDNRAAAVLFGPFSENLTRIESRLDVALDARGGRVSVHGAEAPAAARCLRALYDRAKAGYEVSPQDVDAAVRLSRMGIETGGEGIRTPRRVVRARTPQQAAYITALEEKDLVFGVGPAGTGKTYMAVAQAVAMRAAGRVERLVLCRPAVEAGERLGFLPGDMREKVDPYMRPLYDALNDFLGAEQAARRIERGEIEIAPLAFMRGRTLSRAVVIVDEAQNATEAQMKMVLTRMGEGSRIVITGDPGQVDLPRGVTSGLADALDALAEMAEAAVIPFTSADVVRHPLVARILDAYAARDAARGGR